MTAATSTMLPEHSVRMDDVDSPHLNNSLVGETSVSTSRSAYLDEEPWDERPSETQPRQQKVRSPLMACVEEADQLMRDRMSCEYYDRRLDEDVLEDGDLPTLSLKKKGPPLGGRLVGGQLTTARPMSPPSKAGLVATESDGRSGTGSKSLRTDDSPKTQQMKHSKFWSQLDPPSPEDVEAYEEGPEDELAARQASRRRETDDSANYRDEVESVDRSERPRGVALVETDSNSEANEDNFCDYTLQTLGNMCGVGNESPQRTLLTNTKQVRSVNRRMQPTYDVYEHTAIEVEYVEPPPPVEAEEKKEDRDEASSVTSGSWTPNRKSAYLATMARKAKEDFEKTQAQKDRANIGSSGAESPVPASPRSASTDQVEQSILPDDVYNSFSATEKRKFLKLINSGLTSTESIKKVLAERKANEVPLEEAKSVGSKSMDRGKIFSFWKKGSNKAAAMQRARSAPKSRFHGGSNLDATPSGLPLQGYKSAPTSPMVETGGAFHKQTLESVAGGQSPTGLVVQAARRESTKSDRGPPDLPTFQPPRAMKATGERNPPLTKNVQVIELYAPMEHDVEERADASQYVAAQAATPTASNPQAATIQPTSGLQSHSTKVLTEGEEDNDVQGRFARSGIKYYDAVDKDRPEEEEETEDDFEVASQSKNRSRTARLASIRLHPKSQGFSSLAEKNEKAEQRARSRSLVEMNRLATVSPEGLRRRTLLGIPIPTAVSPTSFAALEDERRDIEMSHEQMNESAPTALQETLGENVRSPRVTSAVVQSSPMKPSAGIRSSEPKLAIGVEEASVHRVENGLLRPTVPSTGIMQVEDEGQPTTQTDFDLASPSSLTLQPSRSSHIGRVEITGMDLGIDTYLDSTNIFTGGADHMSVISGRSGWTAGTGVTGATMSSRKRRPGAAKERLAKAKEAENIVPSKKGWHESIRAAAASTHRVWDPEKGWVDYKDPQAEAYGEKNSERIRICLDTVALTSQKSGALKSQSDVASKSSPVQVPFPEKWERERLEMINRDKQLPKTGVNEARGMLQTDEVKPGAPRVDAWNPRSGAVASPTNLDNESVTRSKDAPVRSYVSPTNLDRNLVATSGGAVTSGYHAMELADGSVSDRTEPRSNLNDWIDRSVDGMASKSELSTHGSETTATVDRTVGGKYMQLGDNGSVRSLLHDPPPKATNSLPAPKKSFFNNKKFVTGRQEKIDEENDGENEALPLLSPGGPAKAPEVEVVKEMCDDDDIDLFNSRVTENAENRVVTMDSPSSRCSGPVDVDEVDNLSSSSDDADEAWEADPFMLGIVSPSLLAPKKPSEPSNNASPISPTNSNDNSVYLSTPRSPVSASKQIPKLTRSKKDTSPVRETMSSNPMLMKRTRPTVDGSQHRPNQHEVGAKRARQIGSASQPVQASPVNEVTISKSKSKLARATTERGDYSDLASSNVDASRATDLQAKEPAAVTASSETASSIVKLRAQQWENRSSRSSDDFASNEEAAIQLSPGGAGSRAPQNNLNSRATAEWKSFLGKKVLNESAVAARQQEDLKAQRSRVSKEPEGGQFSPLNKAVLSNLSAGGGPGFDAVRSENVRQRVDEERDSLFDFEHASNVKRVLQREQHNDKNQNMFADVSPIRSENRDGEDVNHYSDDGFDRDRAEVEREYVESDAGTVDKGSFLQRLKACAATDFPAAHLAFMRTNAGVKNISSRFMPATLCGTPDVVLREGEEEMDHSTPGYERSEFQLPESIEGPKTRSRSTPRLELRPSSSSSVFSEEFGAKTAYLDAIAAKYAVAKPKRSDSRRREGRRSTASDVSVSSRRSQQSEKWQAFLERKSAAGASPSKSQASSMTELSKAAEKYAAEKVEEMMSAMSSRAKSTPRSWPSQQKDIDDPRYRVGEMIDSDNVSTASSSSPKPVHESQVLHSGDKPRFKRRTRKNDSARAAEELAAARVEAMMAAMSSRDLDEGEI